MFEKTRRKIVVAIMSVLILLWVGTLGVIYGSSYYEMAKENKQMLMAHAEMYVLSRNSKDFPYGKPLPDMENRNFEESPKFQLSTFYTVALTYDGEVIETENNQPLLHTNEELESLALELSNRNKSLGVENNLVFYVTDKSGYTLVVFMDNTIIHESAATLFRYTLIFGGIAMVLFFFLAVFLARKILQPVEKSYQKQKQFISDAGHELKTPVSVVSANAELLSRELGENQWLSNIQYENERMGLLVGQLLDLVRTENVVPIMEQIDFSRLVNGEALPFESVAFEKGLALNCNIVNGITVMGNSTQLKQLVSILLDNAVRHSVGGEQVHLVLTQEHNYAKLSVINKGDEIPAEQRKQIFERFYRIDTARNGEDGHYGLGLSIAKSIVTAHKGKIDVLCYNGFVEFSVRIPMI